MHHLSFLMRSRLTRTVLLATLASLTLTAAAAPAEARRVVVDRTNITGNAVYAEWSYQEGTMWTFVALVASKDTSVGPSSSLTILQADSVTGNVWIAGAAYTEDFVLDVSDDLSSAHYVADAIFQDDSTFTFFDTHVDLTFAGSGRIDRQHGTDVIVDHPSLIVRAKFDGKFRVATATGTVLATRRSDSPSRITAPTEFTPMPSTAGQLQDNEFMTLTVQAGKP
jgi:hypothetical protein